MQVLALRRLRRCAAALALVGALSACARSTPLETSAAPAPVLISGDPGTTRQDPATILQARIQGDQLMVQVQFGGGCRDHEFARYSGDAFLESSPVQMRLRLAHDDHGDACRALLGRDLTFDLTPVKDAYRQQYGSHGAVILQLYAPGAAQPIEPSLRYEF